MDIEVIGDFLSGTSRKSSWSPRVVPYVNKAVLEDIDPVFLNIHSATWGGTAAYAPKDAQGYQLWVRR